MEREVFTYQHGWHGKGCFKKPLIVTDQNFVSEDENTITIKEEVIDAYDNTVIEDVSYIKSIDEFIKRENNFFNTLIANLTKDHTNTILAAEKYKNNI